MMGINFSLTAIALYRMFLGQTSFILRGDMSMRSNVRGVNCMWVEIYRGEMYWGEMSRSEIFSV